MSLTLNIEHFTTFQMGKSMHTWIFP
jgi:hypothetical protein